LTQILKTIPSRSWGSALGDNRPLAAEYYRFADGPQLPRPVPSSFLFSQLLDHERFLELKIEELEQLIEK
jgi:hypothetical protein